MKKAILTLALILIAVYAVFWLLGIRDGYDAEKALYRATQLGDKITLNPDAVPPAMVDSYRRDLKALIEKFPEAPASDAAYIMLAENYMLEAKYAEAIEVIDEFVSRHTEGAPILAKGYFLKGMACERLKKYDEALRQFVILQERYSDTPLGIQIPLYMASHYARRGEADKAVRALNEAAAFYDDLRQEKEGLLLGYTASSLLVQAYVKLEEYERAGKIIEYIVINYPSTMAYVQQLPFLDFVYIEKLKRPDKAVEIYRFVIKNTEDDFLKEALKKKIKELAEAAE